MSLHLFHKSKNYTFSSNNFSHTAFYIFQYWSLIFLIFTNWHLKIFFKENHYIWCSISLYWQRVFAIFACIDLQSHSQVMDIMLIAHCLSFHYPSALLCKAKNKCAKPQLVPVQIFPYPAVIPYFSVQETREECGELSANIDRQRFVVERRFYTQGIHHVLVKSWVT